MVAVTAQFLCVIYEYPDALRSTHLHVCAAAWSFGNRVSAFAGIVVSVVSIAFALVPPPGHGWVAAFELKLIGGIVLLMAVGLFALKSALVPITMGAGDFMIPDRPGWRTGYVRSAFRDL